MGFDSLKFGLKQVINASGRMTILGVSTVSEGVREAQAFGGTHFFEMSELKKQTGGYIAELIGAEDAQIVASASSGIALAVAALIGQGSDYHVLHPFTDRITKREVILPKGHNVDYGTAVEVMVGLGGGTVIEAGYANVCMADHVSVEVTDRTAAILYIKSHHTVQKSMLTIKEAINTAHEQDVPIILDAAAEEDLKAYLAMGADLVVYSGAKAIEGPSSGLVAGKRRYIEWIRKQDKGIGRAMKVGKENILGLTQAIEEYLHSVEVSQEEQEKKLAPFIEKVNDIKGLAATIVKDSAGREIYRGSVKVDDPGEAKGIITALKANNPAIYTREYQANIGIIEFDIRSVSDQELQVIAETLRSIMEGE